ncbi:MAG: ketoacyl-ACP synthase III [Clostridiaceae bacterium]|nr:ketoacyl-ACP synthase III [Clostridiaceae bacterium]
MFVGREEIVLNQTVRNAGIVGVGSYVPEKILTNSDLEKIVDTSDEWIRTRTGIEQRRIAEEDVFSSELSARAAMNALKDAGMQPEEVELIIVATITADMLTPSTACIVQHKIGAINAVAFDVNAACSGFIYSLSIASQFIATGQYKNALVIGAETLSKVVDWQDRNTCVLFGDGAGAVVLKATDKEYGILSMHLGADGSIGRNLTIPGLAVEHHEMEKRRPGNYRTLWMDGSEVFKFAVKIMAQATIKVLDNIGLGIDDVDMIIPHQANIRIVNGAAKLLKVSREKIFTNIEKYGNMSAASIPVALHEAVKEGKIRNDDLLVMVGFGGGLTWGSIALRWFR